MLAHIEELAGRVNGVPERRQAERPFFRYDFGIGEMGALR